MKKHLLALSLALFLPLCAHAACQCDEDNGVEDDDGNYRPYNYVGLKDGIAHYMVPGVQGNANSYGLYAGHRYNRIFATEFAYDYLGKYKDVTSDGHAYAFSYSGVGYYDFTDNFSFIGKVGAAYTHPSNASLLVKNSVDLTAGVGFDWRVSSNWAVRLEYDNYKLAIPNKVNVTNGFIGIAMKY